MCVMPMEVVWRCSAKTLEYGIWRGERYGSATGRVLAGATSSRERCIYRSNTLHVRVIVIAERFATIATALQRLPSVEHGLAANVEFEGVVCDYDCVDVCGTGFFGCRGVGGLRGLYCDV